ncbi:unnamed protein product [Clavelina lepadiformis]|uniref:Mothers against decapentaplegic homolog n=1 Tax=Clavelina lepadiformis TaxID=159417 RepID=A0ABP0FYS0_CLALP
MCPNVPMLSLYRKRQLRRKLRNKVQKLAPKEACQLVYELLNIFEEAQLETLFLALDSRGGNCTGCIPPQPPLLGVDPQNIVVAMCKAYRWLDISSTTQLRKMPFCDHPICLNPFHYTKFTDIPLTSLNMFQEDFNLNDEEMFETEVGFGSMSTSIDDDNDVIIPSPRTPPPAAPYPMRTRSHSAGWCSLAYWEGRNRIGRLFPVHEDYVNVFEFLPKGDGLCLAAMTSSNPESKKVKKTIGHGVTIAIDRLRQVWLFNRGEHAIFVHSPVLEPATSRIQLVHKLHSDHCMRVFDFGLATKLRTVKPHVGPYEAQSVRLSFTKGWGGPNYRRQCITTCPCWLEILFNANSNDSS